MVNLVILAVACCAAVTATGNFEQSYFQMIEGYTVVNVLHQLKDVSAIECAAKCTSSARDGGCKLAGYNLNTHTCHLTANDETATSVENNTYVMRMLDICVHPTAPENGQYELSNDRQVANFSCKTGFTLTGPNTLQCVNGTWDGFIPSCDSVPVLGCGSSPAVPSNGDYFDITGNAVNDVATLYCQAGYQPSKQNILCQVDGQWEPTSCDIDCGFPLVPTNGDSFTFSGTTFNKEATLVCLTGYEPVLSPITCQPDGQWEPTSCVFAYCGTTLETDYANVIATYPSGTLAGASATVSCTQGYRSDSGWSSWTFICDSLLEQWTTSQAPDCIWELMFRGTAENGFNVTNAFLFGDSSDGVTSEEGCVDVYNTSCTLNYRNSKVNSWSSLNLAEVFYELYDETSCVLAVKFNGAGSTINSWFSTTSVISHPWSIPSLASTWWDLNGSTDIIHGRSFRMTAGYYLGAVDCADHYYTVVFFPPGWTCAYDDFAAYPKFTYSTATGGSVYKSEPFQTARAMGIWVKYAS